MKTGIFAIILLFLIPCLCACKENKGLKDRVIRDRLIYVYDLKSLIDEKIWPGFNDKKFDVPVIYYGDSMCFVVNPAEKFINRYHPDFIYGNGTIQIYRTPLLDSIPFHMQVTLSLDDPEDFNYKSPYMMCSSTETTNRIVPDVPSTEVWATMIMHEYFHGFQFKHPEYTDYFEKNIENFTQDTLKSLYLKHDWYRKSIDQENERLLSAIAATDPEQIRRSVNSFFQLRDQRRKETKQKLDTHIASIEELFETMEGTARYAEFKLYNVFAEKRPELHGIDTDTLYRSYAYFANFNFEKVQWLYKTGSTYFYATGFNLLRLLDKLDIEYKSRLFKEKLTSPESILRRAYE